MMRPPESVVTLLDRCQQSHLLTWWDEISADEQQDLLAQIEQLDLSGLRRIWQQSVDSNPPDADNAAQRIDSAAAPQTVVRQPVNDEDRLAWNQAAELGDQLLRAGKIAVITVAGGQGSRLGFEHPKGMFPIGPISDRTLFQIFAEQIFARRHRHQAAIPWLIMTSRATHNETVQFFEQQRFFGLPPGTVEFFTQGSLPAIAADTGQVLMESRSSLCLSPDGHGGLITALHLSGSLQRLADAGVEHLFYHQVDNPTVIICDPAFIGFHAERQSAMTTNVVKKVSPEERMGVLVDVNGRTEIIEYSELNACQATREDASGQWIFWAGNTAVHLFSRSFLEQLAEDGCRLPLHVARKNVACLNPQGQLIQPHDVSRPNAIKLERFIFDALPMAPGTLIVEGNRNREFNPVKNRDGADSPQTACEALSRTGREWLRLAGVDIPADQPVEISPLKALDAEELKRKLQSGAIRIEQLLER